MNPLTAYAAAIGHVWRVPPWIRWWRERALHTLQRLHGEPALKIPRSSS